MIWLIVVAAILVATLVITLIVRSRARTRRVALLAPVQRAPMPAVLVTEEAAPASIDVLATSLSERLAGSRGVFDRVRALGASTLGADQLALIEEVLIRADLGVTTTDAVLEHLRTTGAPNGAVAAVRSAVRRCFLDVDRSLSLVAEPDRIAVWLFVGVNGVGKTTTIGKLGAREARDGRRVVMAAGDTFRAAAAEQLATWADRAGAEFVRSGEGADPSSVVHDAISRAAARGCDLVLADTAGRRVTSTNLLDELSKVRRVADRAPGQVLETLLVLDATTGQNALSQAKEFLAAAAVTGIVLTKLDGTARGGIVAAIESELQIPVKLVGVGEGIDDQIPFHPDDFVDALLGADS